MVTGAQPPAASSSQLWLLLPHLRSMLHLTPTRVSAMFDTPYENAVSAGPAL
jgi:hypothetical protein